MLFWFIAAFVAICVIITLLEYAAAPLIEDFVDPDAGDDRQRGTSDASMDYEHEAATDGGTDAELWSHR